MKDYDINKIYEWPFGAKTLFFVFFSILILTLGYYKDILQYRMQINTEIQKETNLKNGLQMLLNQHIAMRDDVAKLSTTKAILLDWEGKIFTKEEIPGMMEEIKKLAKKNHLNLKNFNLGAETKKTWYYKTTLNMTVEGSYDHLASFMSQLANQSKIVNINTVSISNKSLKPLNLSNILSAHLGVEIYRK
jgi:Tfp pilus assembly protein PilO